MSLNDEKLVNILDTLQTLFDEGWDAGMAYSLIVDSTEKVKNQYWNDSEVRESKMMNDALSFIYHEITGEYLSEDTPDTGDGTTDEVET